MRTSLTEIEQIENLLFQKGDASDRLVLEARLMIDSKLRDKMTWQSKVYELITKYGRQKLRKEISLIEEELFNDPKHLSFQTRIKNIFKNK